MKKLKVLAVGAHPDDLEILCGGTLVKYAKLGHKVTMAHLTNGDKGHYSLMPEKVARIRKKEAQNAAAVIGAEVVCLEMTDAMLFSSEETRMAVIDLVRKVRPDVTITLSPHDYWRDHITTSELVCDATFLATVPLIRGKRKVAKKICPIYFCDTVFGINSNAGIYVDITDTLAAKNKMLGCHKSQVNWLRDHSRIDLVRDIECVARFRGLQCGVKYAEVFSEYEACFRKTTARLLP